MITMITVLSSCGTQPGADNGNTDQQRKQTLLISAAASLSDVLNQLSDAYEDMNPHITIEKNYGSSGALQKQIEQGAPVDLFFSAGQKQMDQLEAAGLVMQTEIILQNELVIVANKNISNIKDEQSTVNYTRSLASIFKQYNPKYIALGIPESVPAGQYAKQALQADAIWDEWQSNFVFANDVRQVVAFVEQGNAQIGIVYATDAILSEQVQVIHSVNPRLHDKITYPLAVIKASEHEEEAIRFYQYLMSDEAKKSYDKFGFQIVE